MRHPEANTGPVPERDRTDSTPVTKITDNPEKPETPILRRPAFPFRPGRTLRPAGGAESFPGRQRNGAKALFSPKKRTFASGYGARPGPFRRVSTALGTECIKRQRFMAKKENRRDKRDNTAAEVSARSREEIVLNIFRTFPDKKFTVKKLAAASGEGGQHGRQQTRRIVEQLLEQGLLSQSGDERYQLNRDHLPTYEGRVDMMASGSLYVKVEGQEHDIFVNEHNTRHALHDDLVEVSVTRTRRDGTFEGEIKRIVERSRRSWVGTVDLGGGYAFVRPDSRKMPVDIYIPLKEYPNLKNNQKVKVDIVSWDDTAKNPVGRIADVLGYAGENNAEMHAIMAEFDLPYRFEPEVVEDAERIPGTITPKDYAERRDFRDTVTFTIDPADAKDFDDALSIRKIAEGKWQVGIHIADVTHYVRPGSVVDTEGVSRATSVYLVDRTIPMLPERLSNELCSLRPNEEKLCFSAVFDIDQELNIDNEWFGRTVIYSNRRFTYAEAQAIIETGDGDYSQEVLALHELAQKLRRERFRNGAISFEREEAKFLLDEYGKPLGVYFKPQKESNQLVEEFMLLANRKVAEFVGKKRGKGKNAERTFVYRVHDKPNSDKLSRFTSFILKFGYYFKADRGKAIAKEMNKLMSKIKGKSEENIISTLAVRTMAKAFYSTDNIGHYGLAFPYYTHFTSPIRRYPDMMVHRLLAHYLEGGKSVAKDEYEKLCQHSSDMEVRAADAERASIKYKMVEFMADKIGREFDGHISGITEWGIYVELEETHIEGMVSLRDMPDDFYSFDEESYSVTGERTGRTFTLGDNVRIRVKRADLRHRQLDFSMSGSLDFDTGAFTPLQQEAPRTYTTAGKPKRKERKR